MKNILLLLIVLFSSCKKYDEGGKHYKARERLHGAWTLKEFTVDNADSLGVLNQCVLNNRKVEFFYKSDRNPYGNNALYIKLGSSPYCWEGECYLTETNKNLEFYSSYGSALFYPFCMDNQKWEILKLTNDEFKMSRISVNGKKYLLVLNK